MDQSLINLSKLPRILRYEDSECPRCGSDGRRVNRGYDKIKDRWVDYWHCVDCGVVRIKEADLNIPKEDVRFEWTK